MVHCTSPKLIREIYCILLEVDIVIKTEKGVFTILHFMIDQKSKVDINKLKEVVDNLLDNIDFTVR